MSYPKISRILTNFDVSIILPFYKKIKEFTFVLPLNISFFQRNGIEVIIVLDDPTDTSQVIKLIKSYPFVNWKVLVNEESHAWRNPSKAINVGIKAASKQYILVCSPESQLYTDAIFRLRFMAEYFDPCFAIGKVFFCKYSDQKPNLNSYSLPYGSILVKKNT